MKSAYAPGDGYKREDEAAEGAVVVAVLRTLGEAFEYLAYDYAWVQQKRDAFIGGHASSSRHMGGT